MQLHMQLHWTQSTCWLLGGITSWVWVSGTLFVVLTVSRVRLPGSGQKGVVMAELGSFGIITKAVMYSESRSVMA